MLYLVSLFILLTCYAGTLCLMKYMKNTRLWNIIFTAAIYIVYVSLCVKLYRDVGLDDWNFRNVLPVANVSPFTFTILPFIQLLPKQIKKYFYILISLLTVGMLFSATFNCIYNFSIGYKFHPHFLLDYVAHALLSLYGVYLVKSGQVRYSKRGCLIGGGIIFSVAVVMMILNVIFDTAFFGLSLNGGHNIYNVVVTESSYLSALLYFLGLCLVLVLGYLYTSAFLGASRKKG